MSVILLLGYYHNTLTSIHSAEDIISVNIKKNVKWPSQMKEKVA